jgi:hypothetical protein
MPRMSLTYAFGERWVIVLDTSFVVLGQQEMVRFGYRRSRSPDSLAASDLEGTYTWRVAHVVPQAR